MDEFEIPLSKKNPEDIPPEEGSVEWMFWIGKFEAKLENPIRVSITGSTRYQCPQLDWFNYDLPAQKVKVTNTGYTLMISAKWAAERPYITNGPLKGKYIFSNIHFHWGGNLFEGSEHEVDGVRYPMEMHSVHFKLEYLTQENALLHRDGVVIVAHMFQLQYYPNPRLNLIVHALKDVRLPVTNVKIDPCAMSGFITLFSDDYFAYWGTCLPADGSCEPETNYGILWIVSRQFIPISESQVKEFRSLWNPWDEPNTRNFRPLRDTSDRHVFFVNPSPAQFATIWPIPKMPNPNLPCSVSEFYERHPSRITMPPNEEEIADDRLKMILAKLEKNK